MVELPTPEVISARDTINRRKYAEVCLQKATETCAKIQMAAMEADIFFPGNDLFRKDHTNRKAELGVIIDFISSQLFVLTGHLRTSQAVQFPVDPDLNLFHHIIDRLILMTAILTKDFSRIHTLRLHYRTADTVPSAALFSLVIDPPTPNAAFTSHECLATYVDAGLKAASTLFDLHEKMAGALLKEATSAERKNDILGSWLAQEMYRFAHRTDQRDDVSSMEPAVLMFAFRGYIDLRNNRQHDPNVKKLFEQLTDIVLKVRASKELSKTNPSQINLDRTKNLETALYFFIAQFCCMKYADRIRTPAQQKMHDEEIGRFEWAIQVELAKLDPERKDLPDLFANIVKRAREVLRYGRTDEILELAREVYQTKDVTLFQRAGKPKPFTPIIVAPQATPTGGKRNPWKATAGNSKDVLRQVKEKTIKKRKDKRARFASPPVSRETGGPKFIHYTHNIP